ncbi:MAG TPA: lactonase family protein [Xanthobacteraceae bacterium]|nr:lactonase family protein [Xanthobacteraceae bacterium]
MKPERETTAVADVQRAGRGANRLTPESAARRALLLGAAGGVATLAVGGLIPARKDAFAAESTGAASSLFAYVGCFTTARRKALGKGISVYRIDGGGAWTLLQTLETVPNPQFIAFDRQHRFLYSVHGDGTEVGAYAIDKSSGQLRFLNKQPTNGNNSTHLTPDPSNRYIVIGNGPGVAVFPINPDGSLAPFTDMVPATGEVGPHRNQREAGPHPHYVSFDPSGRFLVAPDRGTDRVLIYRLDATTGKLAANDPGFARTRTGAGPRHLAFHPDKPWAYVCDELDSTVTAYGWNSERGELKALQVIPTLPMTYIGNNSPAEIEVAPSGNFVYVSNRGHNSIVTFSVDPANGMLAPVGWEPTQGRTPRFFTLDPTGGLLYAANLESHNIVVFRVDRATGKLTPTGLVVETGSPSCIIFTRA